MNKYQVFVKLFKTFYLKILMTEKNRKMGLSGLLNLGNSCFLNSIIQCLNYSYEFGEFLNNDKLEVKDDSNGKMLIEYNELRKLMTSKNCIISPKRFYKYFMDCAKENSRDNFLDFQQNDAGECLQFLLEMFHNSLSRSVSIDIKGKIEGIQDKIAKECFSSHKKFYENDYSELLNIFSAIQVTKVIDKKTNKMSSVVCEPFMTLMLPIPTKGENESIQLEDCFDLFATEEKLENHIKSTQFWSFPNTLIIILNRFYNSNLRKNQICVEFNHNNVLDLSKYVIGYNAKKFKYKLYAVCNHTGALEGGHYSSYIKCNKWYHFNDNVIEELGKHKIVSQKAYILFFRKIDT